MIAPEHRAEAARDMQTARELGSVQRFGRTGRCALRVPMDAFMRAVNLNGGVDANGKTCWDDKGFVADMVRHHPHIKPTEEGHIHISFAGTGSAAPRNRFGRIKERIVYGPNGKRHEVLA